MRLDSNLTRALYKSFTYLLNISCLCRRLTAQQKALILSYAETESGTDGTVTGIASTKDGTVSPLICTLCRKISFLYIF